jgi:integrase
MSDNEHRTDLVVYADLETLGQVADDYASQETFSEYQARRSANTLRRQRDDLQLFCTYLAAAGAVRGADELFGDPQAWRGISAGLVKGFVTWQVKQGYAIASVNSRLATIKVYCKMAMDAGALTAITLAHISLVKGYRHKEGRNVDREREVSRIGAKKALPTVLNAGHAELLKRQPDTRIGRRDCFMLYLFLELGLRCGEVRDLERDNLDLARGVLFLYREKVDKEQCHQLSAEALIAAMAYLPDIVDSGCRALFVGYKDKETGLVERITERAINDRVGTLGKRIGLPTLSPHDLRHYWATMAARNQTDLKSLQEAGGWSTLVMPSRYIAASQIANAGVKLKPDAEK